MDLNIWAILAATGAQFVVGAIWYTALFGKLWGQIHGFDKLSKEVQQEMVSKMGPIYGLQLVVTLVTSVVLVKLLQIVPDYNAYALAFLLWIGLVMPAQVSAALFGGTEPQWMVKKIAVQALASLAYLMVAVAVIGLF